MTAHITVNAIAFSQNTILQIFVRHIAAILRQLLEKLKFRKTSRVSQFNYRVFRSKFYGSWDHSATTWKPSEQQLYKLKATKRYFFASLRLKQKTRLPTLGLYPWFALPLLRTAKFAAWFQDMRSSCLRIKRWNQASPTSSVLSQPILKTPARKHPHNVSCIKKPCYAPKVGRSNATEWSQKATQKQQKLLLYFAVTVKMAAWKLHERRRRCTCLATSHSCHSVFPST